MSRFVIVSTAGTDAPAADRFSDLAQKTRQRSTTGCAWLFSAAPEVDDPESALRAAVRDFFGSAEGRRVLQREHLERLGWCEAIPWISEEVWLRHGLTAFLHPDVERILLDEDEDLVEEIPGARGEGSPAAALS